MEQSISIKVDELGRQYVSAADIVDLLYQNPALDFSNLACEDPEIFNQSVSQIKYSVKPLTKYEPFEGDTQEFDNQNQTNWHMPDEYKSLDIAKWLLDQCKTDAELQRIGKELLLYQERDLFPLLRYLKYLVDVMRENNIVWGVGRGSSVASYVLYLLGIHKINSMYYDLDIEEFLK
jgi:DNA polymerase III alpha subunit